MVGLWGSLAGCGVKMILRISASPITQFRWPGVQLCDATHDVNGIGVKMALDQIFRPHDLAPITGFAELVLLRLCKKLDGVRQSGGHALSMPADGLRETDPEFHKLRIPIHKLQFTSCVTIE